jgi:predicted NBD/HSP70 family sugar kinase
MENQSAHFDIQKANRTKVYQLIRQEDGLTRQEIVHRLQLSLPTVTQNINNLKKEGLIQENGFMGHTGGRRAQRYSIIKSARIAIGLDITKNCVLAVAVDLTGTVIDKHREWVTFERSASYYKKLGSIVEKIVSRAGLEKNNILGVGIGVPGLVTADNLTVFYGEILKFTGATCGEFSEFIPYDSALFNDADAAGFAEFWIRRKQGNAFYLMLSNNVGGTVMINNQMLMGDHHRGGEIGHLTLIRNGKPCYCGQKGCADAYLGATILSSQSGGSLAEFFKLLDQKDKTIMKTWDTYLDYLALAVNNLHTLFDCKIILGGYVGGYMEKHIENLKRRVANLNPFEKDAEYLELCMYTPHTISAGAALNFISRFVQSI